MSWSVLILALPQTTWIVDRANGPGTDFTDVPPAVAAAAHGDTIVIRRDAATFTMYTGFQTSGKALTIRGESNTTTGIAWVYFGSVPSGWQFVFEGMYLGSTTCMSGDVVLTDCQIRGLGSQNGSAHVSRCRVFDGGIDLVNSTLVAVDSTIVGSDAYVSYCPQWVPGRAGILATDSRVFLHACSVAGGTSAYRDPFCQTTRTAESGIELQRSTARISGGPGDVIETGTGPGLSGRPAISAGAPSTATVHGNVTLRLNWPAWPGIPLVSSGVTLGAPELPRLSVSGTTRANGGIIAGNPITVSLDSALANAPALLGYAPLPQSPIDFAPFTLGEVMLPLPSFAFAVVLDGAGRLQIVFDASVPPALLGVPVFSQAAVLDGAASSYRMSNLDLRFYTF